MTRFKRDEGVDLSSPYAGVAIIGGSILGAIVLVLLATLVIMLLQRHKAKKEMNQPMSQLVVGPNISVPAAHQTGLNHMSIAHHKSAPSSRRHSAILADGADSDTESDTSSYILPVLPECPSTALLTDTIYHTNASLMSLNSQPLLVDTLHAPRQDLGMGFPHPPSFFRGQPGPMYMSFQGNGNSSLHRANTVATSTFSTSTTVTRPMTITGTIHSTGARDRVPEPRPRYAVDTSLHRTMTMERLRQNVEMGSENGLESLIKRQGSISRVPSTRSGYPTVGRVTPGSGSRSVAETETKSNKELASLWAPAERFSLEDERVAVAI